MNWKELAARVRTKEELIELIRALERDLTTNKATWENATLERYLAALASWLEDSDGFYQNEGRSIPEEPSWRDIADMMIAAKMYE